MVGKRNKNVQTRAGLGTSGKIESLGVGTGGVAQSLGMENGGVESTRVNPGGQGNGGVESMGHDLEGVNPQVVELTLSDGTTIVDDRNGFNNLIRLVMLWTVRHC